MPVQTDRRTFLRGSLAGPAALALSLGAARAEETPVADFPQGKIGNLRVSRMLLGGNLLTHYTHSRDLQYVYNLAAHYNTDEKILETLAAAERHGINTLVVHTVPRVLNLLKRYRHDMGGKIQWIICPTASVNDAMTEYTEQVKSLVDDGVEAIYLWGVHADRLAALGRTDLIRKAVDVAKQHGIPSGVGAHDLGVIHACEDGGIDADFYIKTFHHHDYPTGPKPEELTAPIREVPGYWCRDPQAVIAVMKEVEKPWLAFKVMAAGAIPPTEAFEYAFDNGADHILAGMFDFETPRTPPSRRTPSKAPSVRGHGEVEQQQSPACACDTRSLDPCRRHLNHIGSHAMKLFLTALLAVYVLAAAAQGEPASARSPFFAFCMDTHDSEKRTLAEQAELLAELGYDGAGHLWLDDLEERLATLDAAGLKLFQITLRVNVAPGQEAYDARLKKAMPLLKGRGVGLALLMGGLSSSDPAGMERAVSIVREMADLAAGAGVDVTLYPHTGDWLDRVDFAVRLARKVDRPNVGVMFNLCHWLRVEEGKNLDAVLAEALPLLDAVSIHGADSAEAIKAGTGNWIQPLGEGSYDTKALLRKLRDLGYDGPIGLQCWGIGGDARIHLTKSMAAWRKMTGQPNGDE